MPDLSSLRVVIQQSHPQIRIDVRDPRVNLYNTRGALDQLSPIVTGGQPQPGMGTEPPAVNVTPVGRPYVQISGAGTRVDFLS